MAAGVTPSSSAARLKLRRRAAASKLFRAPSPGRCLAMAYLQVKLTDQSRTTRLNPGTSGPTWSSVEHVTLSSFQRGDPMNQTFTLGRRDAAVPILPLHRSPDQAGLWQRLARLF